MLRVIDKGKTRHQTGRDWGRLARAVSGGGVGREQHDSLRNRSHVFDHGVSAQRSSEASSGVDLSSLLVAFAGGGGKPRGRMELRGSAQARSAGPTRAVHRLSWSVECVKFYPTMCVIVSSRGFAILISSSRARD